MRVLFAADDAAPAAFALTRLGHEVTQAGNGVRALQAWLSDQPELVMLDAQITQMSGFDVCRVIRMSSSVPVMLFVEAGDEEALIRGYECGADDCIVKPFAIRQIELRVEALLRRLEARTTRATERMGMAVVADLVVDSDQAQVYKNCRRVPVTRLEFRILQCLATHAEAVVALDTLSIYVWKGEFPNEADRLKVHVSRLRQKLAAAGGKPIEIRSIPRVGYVLSGRKPVDEGWRREGRVTGSDPPVGKPGPSRDRLGSEADPIHERARRSQLLGSGRR